MKVAASIPRALCLIFLHSFLLNVANCELLTRENTTNYASLWKSEASGDLQVVRNGRSKRSLSNRVPPVLKLRITYATGEMFDLKWKIKSEYVANEYLPVVTSITGFNPNVMSDVGEFVVYHDEAKCSTVVYFEKVDALYGVIGMERLIDGLPFDFNEDGQYRLQTVDDSYIKNQDPLSHVRLDNFMPPLSDIDAWEMFFPPSYQRPSMKRPSNCDQGPSSKRQRTGSSHQHAEGHEVTVIPHRGMVVRRKRFWSETLVFVTRDIVDMFKLHYGEERYFEWIVRYYIIYFNIIDSTFQKLHISEVEFNINIAKIVIDDVMSPFDFISDGELQFTDIVNKARQYLRNHQASYMPDSFDHVFIHTSRTILDDFILVNGLSQYGEDLYESRKTNRFYETVPITVVTFLPNFLDYAIAVQEIGRVLTVKVDPFKKNMLVITGQCYGLMQRGGARCIDCLKWSDESREGFRAFFSKNRNRCFLLNYPRSLRSHGRGKLITPKQQCQCFGYSDYRTTPGGRTISDIGTHNCGKLLQCQVGDKMQSSMVATVLPFDGTQCARNKVCWNRECVTDEGK